VVVGFVVMEPKSPTPLRNDIILTAADISYAGSSVTGAQESETPIITAGAGVMVLAQLVPDVSHPITSLQVVDDDVQLVVGPARQSVRQELKVLVVHSSELGSTLLGSLESVKPAKFLVSTNGVDDFAFPYHRHHRRHYHLQELYIEGPHNPLVGIPVVHIHRHDGKGGQYNHRRDGKAAPNTNPRDGTLALHSHLHDRT
jgi:hypothetical protein